MPKGDIRRTRNFFFWEGKLHKVLKKNRPANLVEAWRFEDGKRVVLLYSDWRENAGRALNHKEAAELIRLKPDTLNQYIYDGLIPSPQKAYGLDGGPMRPYYRYWSEDDMLKLHDFLMSQHRGAPRKDGGITPMQHLPTRAEIIAAFNGSEVLYKMNERGELVPLFKAQKQKW